MHPSALLLMLLNSRDWIRAELQIQRKEEEEAKKQQEEEASGFHSIPLDVQTIACVVHQQISPTSFCVLE